jgi:hypothetical protein
VALEHTFASEKEAAQTADALDKQLTQLILDCVPDMYLKTLASSRLGYRGVTSQAMLAHLETTYGNITADCLEENIKNAEAPWDTKTPVENAFNNILEAMDVATTGNDPISEASAVRMAVKLFEQSGVLEDAVKDWRKRTAGNRTWTLMQPFFIDANKERLRLIATNELGFGSANATQGPPTDTATQGGTPPNNPAPNNGARSSNNFNNTTITGVYYCWTHGIGFNPNHTSTTCTYPHENHKTAATFRNMMGGNNMIKRKRNKRQVWQPPAPTNN